ncbi:MAG: nitrous oxide reductase accessory protein NosL [Acidimicrobiia bacterium]|nr:nitrous oxide reductase accessory protein NosL [Acidimicrobiia bacterium]
MKERILTCLAALLLGSLAAGCSDPAEASGPPEISYGRDICVECNMIISEPRFAAAYRLDDGEAKVFDGVGELVKHAHRHDEFDRIAFAWAHDYYTEEWILVESAHFVAGEGVVTPMGHGIVAFATMEDATAFAGEREATVLRWDEVAALPLTSEGLLGHHHHDDDEAGHGGDDTGGGDHMDHDSHDG